MKNRIALFLGIILMTSCSTSKNEIFWLSGIESPCSDEGNTSKCLDINRAEKINSQSWEKLDAVIEGVTPEKGMLQKVEVKKIKQKSKNKTADNQSASYKLISIMEKVEDSRFKLDGNWALFSLKGDKLEKLSAIPTLKIEVAQMNLSGNGGCNTYYSKIKELTANKIVIEPGIATLKACKNDNIESDYLKTLNSIYSYGIINNRLLFFNDQGEELLSFIKNDTKLLDHTISGDWIVKKIYSENIYHDETTPTLTIDSKAKNFKGNDGCNNYFGEFEELSGQQMVFGGFASTKKLCLDMEITNNYNQALRMTASYQITESKMLFLDIIGNVLMEFERQ